MLSLILLFSITLSVILFASYREIRKNNAEMLERYAELYSLEKQLGSDVPQEPPTDASDNPGPKPDGLNEPATKPDDLNEPRPKPGDTPLDQKADYQLSTFYSVALGEGNTILAVDNGDRDVYTEEELTAIAEKLLSEGRTSGRTNTLSYIVRSRPDYTLVAFMDNTVTDNSMQTLLHYVLLVGSIAIIILFFLSLFLSKRIIRPLEENDRQQRQFISDASHELKTPVAVISANAELLERELGENEWLANIQYENVRMGDLVKQLLDLSRAENSEISMEPVDFSRTVTGEILAFESLAFDAGKVIQSDVEDGIFLKGNQAQLTQLISILLDNAIRHSSGNEIDLSLNQQAWNAILEVINDGEVIPPDKLEHIFDRFYRVDEARSSDSPHYGLGLSIAKAVTEKHGGSIRVSCSDGKVCFSVTFPMKN